MFEGGRARRSDEFQGGGESGFGVYVEGVPAELVGDLMGLARGRLREVVLKGGVGGGG